jgi:methionyl-tRNA synthetase
MNTVLYVLTEVIRHIAIYVQPVMPESSSRILDQLGQKDRTFAALKTALVAGTALCEPIPIFPRIEQRD